MCPCFSSFFKLGCGKSCVAFRPHVKAGDQENDTGMASNRSNLSPPEFPAAGSPQRANVVSSGRGKVALKPGHSLIDWIKLGKCGKDLTGVGGKFLDVSPEELAKHNTREDAWICLKGKVFNATPYFDFHPGGPDELIKGAGIDATDLFNEVHKWVNADSMLEHCVVGRMLASSRRGSLLTMPITKNLLPKPGIETFAPPTLSVPTDIKQSPKFDWFQTDAVITLVIYTKWKDMRPENVILDNREYDLTVTVFLEKYSLDLQWELEDLITPDFQVKVIGGETGKVEITITKAVSKTWNKFKNVKEDYMKTTLRDVVYRNCTLISKEMVTHDTYLLCFEWPKNTWMRVPIGYHVYLKHTDLKGMELIRPYTVVIPSFNKDKQDQRFDSGQVVYLMIKFYSDGILTPQLACLNIGDKIEISDYDGTFNESRLHSCTNIVLLAAGTGFTPMIRLLYYALFGHKENGRERSVKLMFFNKKEEDILWKDQLDDLAKEYNQFELVNVLSGPSSSWSGPTGRISRQHLEGFIKVQEDYQQFLVGICGPILFTELALQLLEELGYPSASIHAFT